MISHCSSWARVVALLILVPAASAHAGAIASFSTTVSGDAKLTLLESVTLVDGRIQGPNTGLIGVNDVFHYSHNTSTSGTTTTIWSPYAAASIPSGSRAAVLDVDAALNTGIMNINQGAGIPVGERVLTQPTDPVNSVGLGINFNSPVINGPGVDIVFFEAAPSSGASLDPFIVSALVGGQGYDAVSAGAAAVDPADYTSAVQVISVSSYSQPNPLASLVDLENKPLTAQTLPMGPPLVQTVWVRAIGIDLNDLGVPLNGSATGLFIQSSSTGLVDPVFIAGLQPVPEPTAVALLSATALFLRPVRRLMRARRLGK